MRSKMYQCNCGAIKGILLRENSAEILLKTNAISAVKIKALRLLTLGKQNGFNFSKEFQYS